MLEGCTLGTGGTLPIPDRALSSLYLRVNGQAMLIDCGEGTQVGIRRHLKRGNALGLAYSWQYVTSRTAEDTAPWRFQQASHGLTFQLLFCL